MLDACRLCLIVHLPGLLCIVRQRLFAQNVQVGIQGIHRDGVMGVIRGDDQQRIQVPLVNHFPIVVTRQYIVP